MKNRFRMDPNVQKINALKVNLSQVSSKVSAKVGGLREGDLIIGVDGVLFTDLYHIMGVWIEFPLMERLELFVQRDGERIRLLLSDQNRRMLLQTQQGFSLDPAHRP